MKRPSKNLTKNFNESGNFWSQKKQQREEAEQKALEEEAKAAVEKELGITATPTKMEEKTSIPVESGSEASS